MLSQYLTELWQVLLDLAPALLLGLLLAGILGVYLPRRLVRAHLSRAGLGSSVRAALIGVPMPLCSCGVVPTAIGLRNQGASKGATASFLISTPQTGVDSVLVSASFLGWPFALFKLAAAFATGVLGGWLVDRFIAPDAQAGTSDEQGEDGQAANRGIGAVLRYALFDLLAAFDLWLVGGLLVAAAISTLAPPDYFHDLAWASGLGGMLLVLAVALPLYVCTTGSVPIAASLIAAGMPAGSALVFLMAGPATNIATMGIIYRTLGLRVLSLYLATVIVSSIGLGMGFDFVLGANAPGTAAHAHGADQWWEIGAALLLIGLLAFLLGRRLYRRLRAARMSGQAEEAGLTLRVEGMACQHCAANVKNALEGMGQVQQAEPNLATGLVRIKTDSFRPVDKQALAAVVTKAGYKVLDS
jgi:uncharacterized membrane protein YraQ (UPF0718 family)/copper chaperone CopZ